MAIHCNRSTFPFSLYFEDVNGRSYPITKLWDSRGEVLHEDLLVLKENARIGIRFYTENEYISNEYLGTFIQIQTSRYRDVEEKEVINIPLASTSEKIHWLYQGNTDEEYPWRMGIYLIEFHINGNVFYTGIKVIPIHLKVEQVEKMHQFLNEQVHGIIYDFVYSNESLAENEEVELPQYWYYDYARRISEYYTDFMHAMTKITKYPKDQIITERKTSLQIGKSDGKSIRWEVSNKGIVKNRGSYQPVFHLNKRKRQELNTVPNQWLKNLLLIWVKDIGKVSRAIRKDADSLQRKISELKVTYASLLERKEKLSHRRNVGEYTKRDIKSRLIMVQKDITKAKKQYCILNGWIDLLSMFENKVVYFLEHSFLSLVERNYRKPMLKSYYYYCIDQMYQTIKRVEHNKGNQTKLVPILKPTWQIYEYFCLFKIVDVFRKLGFQMVRGINDNIINYYFEDRIPEGSHFILEKEDIQVHIWYDHYHAHDSEEATSIGEQFYAPSPKKKPDIKVDYFKIEEDHLRHHRTIIFDSKFRKFKDIYSSSYSSTTSEQLNSYFMFFYLGKEHEKEGTCVNKVICLYAGDDTDEVVINKHPLKYIKVFPSLEVEEEAVGEMELTTILEEALPSSSLTKDAGVLEDKIL